MCSVVIDEEGNGVGKERKGLFLCIYVGVEKNKKE